MPNHLIIGANGIIGSALFAELQSQGAHVFGTTHKKDKLQENIFYLNLLDSPEDWKFPISHFDVVYVCAGVCRMALCEDDPIETRKANVEGTHALIKLFAERGSYVVFLSTNQVFSGDIPFMHPHGDYQPMNEYGKQKSETERLIKDQSAILRLTKVIEPQNQLVTQWINQLSAGKSIDAFKDMMLAPVTLMQVVRTLIKLGQKKLSGIFQLSGAEDISYFQFANYVAKKLNRPPTLVQSISALERGIKKIFLPRFTTLDCSVTIGALGEKPQLFSEVLRECFDTETVQANTAH